MIRRGLPTKVDLEKNEHRLYEGVEYKQFWTGLQKQNLDELERAIVSDLIPVSGRRIVDLGCGYGRLSDCYMERFQQVVMVDGSMSLLRQACEKTAGRATYIACDVNQLPFRTASFDAVLMIRVFHHIDDSMACISEFHRLLSNNGRLIFNYCNKQNAKRILQWLLRINRQNPFTTEMDGVGSTFISHHPAAVQGMLREAGFAELKYYGTGVLDRLAGNLGLSGKSIAMVKHSAPFLAWIKLAPWMLCSAVAEGNSSLIDASKIDDLFQCPICGGDVAFENPGYMCLKCNRSYPVEDGIIDFRV